MRSEVNLAFSDVSVRMRNFWKTLAWKENGVFKCIQINLDVASLCRTTDVRSSSLFPFGGSSEVIGLTPESRPGFALAP